MNRVFIASRTFWVGIAALAGSAAVAIGCSSSSSPPDSCTAGTTLACSCANGQSGSKLCGASDCTCGTVNQDGGETPDSGQDAGVIDGDGGHLHEGGAPNTLYGACAVSGGFGWPCGNDAGVDPTVCTDTNYPFCFVGGQGSWCTKACSANTDCTIGTIEDAGCVPTACNARGYCK